MVTTRPELTTPKHLFDFWMKSKNLFRSNSFDSSDDFLRRIHDIALNQKMNMIFIKTNLQKMNFLTLLYFQANLLESQRNSSTQYFPTIFNRTNRMIQKQAFVMTLVDMFVHKHKSNYLYSRHEAEPRGILLIKKRKI